MFYSPKKDLERYVSIKNHQIRTLKEQIQNEKVTQENIEMAKKRLDKLKDQHNQLCSEHYNEYIQTIKKNQDKMKIFKQEIILRQKQIDLKKNQYNDVLSMRTELLEKINKTKAKIQSNKNNNASLKAQRSQLDEKVTNLTKLNDKLRNQTNQINHLQSTGKKELNDCKVRLDHYEEKSKALQSQMNQTGMRILGQKERINLITHEVNVQEMKIQNIELKIQNTLQVKATLLEQKEKIQIQKLIVKQRTELNRHQSVSEDVMKVLVRLSEAMKQSKEKEKQNCGREIKEKLIEVEISECVNNELLNSVTEVKEKIQEKEKKITKINGQMEKILVKDVDLVTMVMGKERNKTHDKSPLKSVDTNKQIKSVSKHTPIKSKQSQWKHNHQVVEDQNHELPFIQF